MQIYKPSIHLQEILFFVMICEHWFLLMQLVPFIQLLLESVVSYPVRNSQPHPGARSSA